ncbi:MAG: M23 family metallopeptidase [Thermoflexales bacterium]|nr:M23 family metallopeptidase [Thermoflexales bacterium]
MKKRHTSTLWAILVMGAIALLVTASSAAAPVAGGATVTETAEQAVYDVTGVPSLPIVEGSATTSFEYWPLEYPDTGLVYVDDPSVLQNVGNEFLLTRLNSDFGLRDVISGTKYHPGLDMATEKGTPVVAVADGIVIEIKAGELMSKWPKEKGKFKPALAYVTIFHPELGICTKYQHIQLSPVNFNVNDNVQAGDIIAYSGPSACPSSCQNNPKECSCGSYGAHLHLGVIKEQPHTHCWEYSNSMVMYHNPLEFFPYLNADVPQFSELFVRLLGQTSYSQATGDNTSAIIKQSKPFWVSTEVRSDDKDIDQVSVWISDFLFQDVQDIYAYGNLVYTFDYYSGTSGQNESMYFNQAILTDGGASFANGTPPERESYVCPGSTGLGLQSNDKFYVLFDPTYWIKDNNTYYLTFIARDVLGNETHSHYLFIQAIN